jgi:ribose transport system permease protein
VKGLVEEQRPRALLSRRRPQLRRILISSETGMAALVALAAILFVFLTRGFDSPFNLFGLTRSAAVNILIGLSMMSVIVSGGLDLSIGAIGVCASIATGSLIEVWHWPMLESTIMGILCGGCLGLVNGQLIARSGIHSFIITLATMSLFFGGMIVLTQGVPFDHLPDGFGTPAHLRMLHWISPLLIFSLAAALLMSYLYRLTDIGRALLAAGANPRAARLAGISVSRTITISHTVAGILAAGAGLMLSMRNGAAIPSMAGNLGQDWLLPAFLSPILGGTSLAGGRVSVLGTVLGALLVTIIDNGLLLLHVGVFWVQFFLGTLLLGAVLLDKGRARMFAFRGRAQ